MPLPLVWSDSCRPNSSPDYCKYGFLISLCIFIDNFVGCEVMSHLSGWLNLRIQVSLFVVTFPHRTNHLLTAINLWLLSSEGNDSGHVHIATFFSRKCTFSASFRPMVQMDPANALFNTWPQNVTTPLSVSHQTGNPHTFRIEVSSHQTKTFS